VGVETFCGDLQDKLQRGGGKKEPVRKSLCPRYHLPIRSNACTLINDIEQMELVEMALSLSSFNLWMWLRFFIESQRESCLFLSSSLSKKDIFIKELPWPIRLLRLMQKKKKVNSASYFVLLAYDPI